MADLVLVDTSILFDFMADHDTADVFEQLLLDHKAALSIITVYELFRGVEKSQHITQREELIGLCKIVDLDLPIARKASEIYTHLKKSGLLIAHEDILIAATALVLDYPLLSKNQKDYQKISGLKLV